MALNGRKYKSVTSPQADLQVAISWGNIQALRVTRVETYRLEVLQRLQVPDICCWEAYTWTHPEKHHHWNFIAVMYARSNRIRWHAISHFLDWQMGHVIVQTSDMNEQFREILRFLRFNKKSDRSLSLTTNKFALFSVVVHTELYFMLHAWGFHHCGWTAFRHQM